MIASFVLTTLFIAAIKITVGTTSVINRGAGVDIQPVIHISEKKR